MTAGHFALRLAPDIQLVGPQSDSVVGVRKHDDHAVIVEIGGNARTRQVVAALLSCFGRTAIISWTPPGPPRLALAREARTVLTGRTSWSSWRPIAVPTAISLATVTRRATRRTAKASMPGPFPYPRRLLVVLTPGFPLADLRRRQQIATRCGRPTTHRKPSSHESPPRRGCRLDGCTAPTRRTRTS